MADNTTLPAGVGGDTIRDIDKGGLKTQVTILDFGGAGAEQLVTLANGMPVQPGTGTTWAISSIAGALPTMFVPAGKAPAMLDIAQVEPVCG